MNLQKMLKEAGQAIPASAPILEINPDHPLVRNLKTEQAESRVNDWSELLFDQAMLSEGGQLEDPAAFVKRMNDMLLTLTMSAG